MFVVLYRHKNWSHKTFHVRIPSMDTLGKLFGSTARVKIMRLFLLNSEDIFETTAIIKRSKITKALAQKEVALLYRAGFIVKKQFTKVTLSKKKGAQPSKKKAVGWRLNLKYSILPTLKILLLNSEPLKRTEIASKFKKAGNIKLIITSGVFMQESDSRVDILIVGDNLNKGMIETALRNVEAEVGKELSYAFFNTQEYNYRLGICDKFVRDVLDYPHTIVMDKLTVDK